MHADFWDAFIRQLQVDGLTIESDPASPHSLGKARHYLPRIGVYRFRGYYEPFRRALDSGQAVGLNDVLRLYKFDRRLRLLCLDALERVEVALKAQLADHFFGAYGPGWLTRRKIRRSFSTEGGFKEAKKTLIDSALQRYRIDHPGSSPSLKQIDWAIAFESTTFGDASRIFSTLNTDAQRQIASVYSLQDHVLADWLRGLTRVRNIAAHHGRLWNTRFLTTPKMPPGVVRRVENEKSLLIAQNRFYVYAITIYYLLRRIARRTQWHQRLFSLINDATLRPTSIDLPAGMGFPIDWHTERFWNLPINVTVGVAAGHRDHLDDSKSTGSSPSPESEPPAAS